MQFTDKQEQALVSEVFAELQDVREGMEALGYEGDETMDVRLCLQRDGSWDILTGDASYDTDHNGYWGAGSVERFGTNDSLRDIAADLVSQALDMMAQDSE